MGEALPPRPSGVPTGARWSEGDGEWQSSATDADGRLDGPFRAWRADGSLRTIARHQAGKQVDVAWRFHPDGSLFSLGSFVDGAPRGVHRRYANSDALGERLQSCCVPAGAWQLRQDYRDNGSVDQQWFDHAGLRLLDSGAPYPQRPAAVPAEAWFNESMQTWEAGLTWVGEGYTGTRRRWSPDGVLRLIENLVSGRRQGLVSWFDEGGKPVCDAAYENDRLSGSFRSHQAEAGYFADASLGGYQGTFVRDQAVGDWRLFQADGSGETRLDLGAPSSEETLADVLTDVTRAAAEWAVLARSSLAAGRVAEFLLATARLVAGTGDVSALRTALAERTLPLHPDRARAAAADLMGRAPEDVVALVDGLRRGWDACELLVAIAKALPDRDRAALDLATAAALLAPGTAAPLATRALLYGSLGDPAAARRDIEAMRACGADQAGFLDLYLRAYFPTFDFWPARELAAESTGDDPVQPVAAAEPIAPCRSVEEIREVMQRYATRLARLRALIEDRAARPGAVALPEPPALLADEPIALSQWTFTMSAAEYGGDEETEDSADGDGTGAEIELAVDEALGLDLDGSQLLRILRRARADWAGLVWLCWAVGLDHVAIPTAIAPPPAFAQQAVQVMQRTWRCRDKLNTSGLLALTKGIPGFDWEGTSIDLVPLALAEVALDEYLERRAVFAWLCDPANRSVWQEDLRAATS